MSEEYGFTEEHLNAFYDDNSVNVELECSHGIYAFELNRACNPKQLVASLRQFADQIEEATE